MAGKDTVLRALLMSPQSAASLAGMVEHEPEFAPHVLVLPRYLDDLVNDGAVETYLDNGVQMFRLSDEALPQVLDEHGDTVHAFLTRERGAPRAR